MAAATSKAQRLFGTNAKLSEIITVATKEDTIKLLQEKGLDLPINDVLAAVTRRNQTNPPVSVVAQPTPIALQYPDEEIEAIAADVNRCVSLNPLRVNVNYLTGRFSRHPVPQVVEDFVTAQGARMHSVFLDFVNSPTGECPSRSKYVISDYAFLVSTFTVWAMWVNTSYRNIATAEAEIQLKPLLEMAEHVGEILNGDRPCDTSAKHVSGDLVRSMAAWKQMREAGRKRNRSSETRRETSTHNSQRGGHRSNSTGAIFSSPPTAVSQSFSPSRPTGGRPQGQAARDAGCWECGDLNHIKKHCPKLKL